jgi:alkylation response protein AidB-like acyl-CoA dehydrogenase
MTDLIGVLTDLEGYLGDPNDPASRMPYARILELDEREEYPHELMSPLRRWGLHEWLIPEACGGKAVNVEDGLQLTRLVARRDPTTATAFMINIIGFMPVWVAGTETQKQHFADLIRTGGSMAWGLSEKAHGSDILANELSAERVEGGYLLTGEKWTIGNATVADVVMVFARTNAKGGPGGYSIFALDKRTLPAGSWEPVPREHMYGLRGLDMSGVRLHGCFLPDEALIGGAGKGLEIALKSSQLVRTNITSIALGCADTALRTTLDFATGRRIFDTTVADIPYSRRQLVECFADLLIGEAVATGAVRGLQANPAQASITSSVAKYFVPTMLERTMSQLAVVLGARYYLRDDPRYGMFQKVLRDAPVANFADGNTVVNLKNIASSLDKLLATAAAAPEPATTEANRRMAVLFDPAAPMGEYRPADQQLFARGVDDVLLGLPASIAALRRIAAGEGGEQAKWWGRAADLAESLAGEARRMRADLDELTARYGTRDTATSAELFDLAKQYCTLFAVASCVHLWAHGRSSLAAEVDDGAVLLVCLERLRQLLHPTGRVTGAAEDAVVARAMLAMHAGGRLFALRPIPLGAPGC